MIFIVVKFDVARGHREDWPSITKEFTAATRAEPGNLWFEWSRSVDNPSEYILVEAFRDQDAGVAHVRSAHFQAGLDAMRPALTRTPQIIHTEIDADGWSQMGELQIDG
ncbi:antibiotic biosynthesis monooxygenase [Mycobacterium sp. Y57]|uniref:putative quinol monooxygenase n=1 Tax=Mycolicibacterium xanthum TaxID=2796469 RepID=UPI001C862319|nr:putative quinol monooxygenase [Mycolicibacterium xanthum]MBX7434893.1 antibiotic biosynthesis monooxygenase [Mycolicibacterium xanthum]